MATQLLAYSFKDIKAAIVGPGGNFSLGSDAGVAEEGISIEMLEDKDTLVIGADGTPMHSLNAGQGGRCLIRFLKTASTNNLLSVMLNFQRSSSSLWGLNTITITDVARGDVTTCLFSAFMRQPNNAYAKNGNIIEWGFNVGRVEQLLGAGLLL